jgi:hypothetical protein
MPQPQFYAVSTFMSMAPSASQMRNIHATGPVCERGVLGCRRAAGQALARHQDRTQLASGGDRRERDRRDEFVAGRSRDVPASAGTRAPGQIARPLKNGRRAASWPRLFLSRAF